MNISQDLFTLFTGSRSRRRNQTEQIIHRRLIFFHEEVFRVACLQEKWIHDHVVIFKIILVWRNLELIGVSTEVRIAKSFVQFIDLRIDRFDSSSQFIDEVILEFTDGVFMSFFNLWLRQLLLTLGKLSSARSARLASGFVMRSSAASLSASGSTSRLP